VNDRLGIHPQRQRRRDEREVIPDRLLVELLALEVALDEHSLAEDLGGDTRHDARERKPGGNS
jgi:hypothetical protein